MIINLFRYAIKTVLFTLISASVILAQETNAANSRIMKLNDIKDGMRGKAYTTIKGSAPVEYDVEILGRVPNGLAPGLDILLARLSGENIEKIGVFAGMSGSPIFIENKFAGSISYQIGAFSKEIIGGVTPAEYILDVSTPLPETQGIDSSQFLSALESNIFSQKLFDDPALQSLLPASIGQKPMQPANKNILKELNLPLFSAGINNSIVSRIDTLLAGSGMQMMKMDSSDKSSQWNYQIKSAGDFATELLAEQTTKLIPGSAIFVPLLRGDISLGASGTLTYVDDKKIYAFGHEFLRMGVADMPIHAARVITVFASDYSGFHIVAPGDEIGCITEDRICGIYGTLGKKASMIPIEIQVRNKGNLIKKYNLESIQGKLSPILLWLAGEAAIGNTISGMNQPTVKMKSIIQMEGDYNPIVIENVFSGAGAASQASLLPAAALYMLVNNQFEIVKIQSIKVSLDYYLKPLDAEIMKIRFDKEEVAPGEKVGLKIYLRTWRGKTVVKTADLKIPASFPLGGVSVIVSDADKATLAENAGLGKSPVINDLKHLMGVLNSIKSKNTIYIQLYHLSQGVFEYGRILNDLPLTTLEVIKAKKTDNNVIPIVVSMLSEDRLETDLYITGKQSFSLNIKKKPETEEK
jgi:hypothetical protein